MPDYAKLAEKYGATPQTGNTVPSTGIDYSSVAQKYGGTPIVDTTSATAISENTPRESLLKSIPKAVFKGAVTDPFKALITRPAIRTGQAIGDIGLTALDKVTGGKVNEYAKERTGQDLQTRLQQASTDDVKGIGGMMLSEGVKTGVAGAKQIAGEGIESGVDIASLALGGSETAKTATANTFKKGLIKGAWGGAKTGATFGAGTSLGKSLQADNSIGRIIVDTGTGALGGFITGGILGGILGGGKGYLNGRAERSKALQEGFKATRQPTDIIEYAKDPTGKVIKDVNAQEALKQGVSPEDVQFIKNSSPEDKALFKESYDLASKGFKDKVFGLKKQPVEVPGKILVDNAKHLVSVKKDVGAQLGSLAKNMKQEPLDITPVTNTFIQNLDDSGITITDDIKGTSLDDALNFSNSRYADQPAAQKQITDAFKFLFSTDGKGHTPAQIIAQRQKMFTNLQYAKQNNQIIPGDNVERMLKQVYDTLDDPIKQANPEYGALAQTYAEASNALRDFGQVIGKNFDLSDDLTSLRAGEVGNRVLGKASSVPQSVINKLIDTSKALGYKGKEDFYNQILFNNLLLEDPTIFPITQKTGFAGRTSQGIVDATQKLSKGGSLTGKLVDLVGKGVEIYRDINPEAKRKALEKLIGM